MAATKTTRNKLQNCRRVIYWLAQAQGDCPFCKEPLVNGRDSDVYDLTVEHCSGNYDHRKREERGKKGKTKLAHRRCHKSYTMRKLRIWKHRGNGAASKE